MSAGSFKQDGLGWRIDLVKRRVGEWLELKATQFDTDSLSWLKSKLLWQIVTIVMWSLIAILLVWLTWQLWLFLRPYLKRWQRSTRNSPLANAPVDTTPLSKANWLEQSQSARIEGNYSQAIFCLYQAMLQLLDERGTVPWQSSRTDGEYRRSLTQQISATQPYDLLLSMHQRLCFSQAEADRSMFEQCQQAYQQIEVNPHN